MRYVALSYVWGPKKRVDSSSLSTEGGELPAHLPRTIESAIITTKSLELQYLWVDRYCIDQDHGEDKTNQINQMANIYSHAVVTICALGEHDNIHLPGVTCDRKKQLRVETPHLTLAWTGPSIRRVLQHSAWMTRGWTYQEAVLSRRCLFFTEYYAALICEAKVSTENVVSGKFPAWSFDKDAQIRKEENALGRRLYPAQALFKHVAEFSKRKLSFKSDTLNAFKGILSQLQVQSYWGIPVCKVTPSQRDLTRLTSQQEQEAGFIAGLCWQMRQKKSSPLSTSSAETPSSSSSSSSAETPSGNIDDLGFPSWSWVGSDYPMISNHMVSLIELEVATSHFSSFQASVAVRRLDDTSISFQELRETYRCSKVIPEQTRFLELTSVVVTWQRLDRPRLRTREHLIAEQYLKIKLLRKRRTRNEITRGSQATQRRISKFRPERSRPAVVKGSAARPTSEIPWWQLDTLGDSYLDTEYSDPEQRHAVLLTLALDPSPHVTYGSIRAVWLAVEKMADGTFRRRGVIILNYTGWLDFAVGPPWAAWLETIVLG